MESGGDSEVEVFLQELNRQGGPGETPLGFQAGGPNPPYVAFLRRRVHAIRLEKSVCLQKLRSLEQEHARAREEAQRLWQDLVRGPLTETELRRDLGLARGDVTGNEAVAHFQRGQLRERLIGHYSVSTKAL